LTQKFKFIEAFARSFRHGAQRIFSHMDRQTGFLAQKFIEAALERAAARQNQATIDMVRRKFRRATLQRDAH
jgi:hypothetical protein